MVYNLPSDHDPFSWLPHLFHGSYPSAVLWAAAAPASVSPRPPFLVGNGLFKCSKNKKGILRLQFEHVIVNAYLTGWIFYQFLFLEIVRTGIIPLHAHPQVVVYNCVKFLQYRFICWGVVADSRHLDRKTNRAISLLPIKLCLQGYYIFYHICDIHIYIENRFVKHNCTPSYKTLWIHSVWI